MFANQFVISLKNCIFAPNLKIKAMFKKISFFIVISFVFITISCIDSVEEQEQQRTPELEAAEIDAVINQIEEDGFNVDTTDLGVYYVVQEEGTGPFPTAGDTIFMEYTGYFLDGTVFDNSFNHFPEGIWEFNYMENSLIPGFEDGIALLNSGAEVDMIIPSHLAYGTGTESIPPYTPLIFATKMHDLKPVIQP